MSQRKRNTVYSTDPAFKKRCQTCGSFPCRCPKDKTLPPSEQTACLYREKKGRGGKTVTVVRELQLTADDRKKLAKRLKVICGSGGAIKDKDIEVQGDHRDKIGAELKKMGYKIKNVGG